MSVSPIRKFLLPSLLISGAVFSVLTFPLAVVGSNEMVIEVEEETIFNGQLRDVAAPYLGLATAVSLGSAITTIAVTGWKQSKKKISETEENLSELKQVLQEKETQLEQFKIEEIQLHQSELSTFIEQEGRLIKDLVAEEREQKVTVKAVTKGTPLASTPEMRPQEKNGSQMNSPKPPIQHPESISRDPSGAKIAIASSSQNPVPSKSNSHAPFTIIQEKTAKNQTLADPLMQLKQMQTQFQQMMSQIQTLEQVLEKTPELEDPKKRQFDENGSFLEQLHYRLLVLEAQQQQYEKLVS